MNMVAGGRFAVASCSAPMPAIPIAPVRLPIIPTIRSPPANAM